MGESAAVGERPPHPPPAPRRTERARSGPREQQVTVDVESRGRTVIVSVAGEIDVVTADEVQSVLDVVRCSPFDTLVIDLTRVGFLASAGLRLLVACSHALSADGVGPLRVVADGPATLRPIRLTGLGAHLEVHSSLGAALRGPGE
ncbi:STAS domain-containing protein [Rhodococcus olei]